MEEGVLFYKSNPVGPECSTKLTKRKLWAFHLHHTPKHFFFRFLLCHLPFSAPDWVCLLINHRQFKKKTRPGGERIPPFFIKRKWLRLHPAAEKPPNPGPCPRGPSLAASTARGFFFIGQSSTFSSFTSYHICTECDFLIFSWLFRHDFLIFSWIIRTRKMHF